MAEERLRIVLSAAGGAGVQGSLKSVQGAVSALQSSAARVAGVLGIGGLGAAFVSMTRASIDSASTLVDTADKIGVGIEAYQALSFAAEQSGVSTEQFDTALTKLGVNISKAASGSKEVAATFRALGVSLLDANGHILPTEEVLRRLADAFQDKLPNAADRSRVAVELFGKAGAPMVNLLRDGSAGLDLMAESARSSGVVLAEASARGLEAMGDELDRLSRQLATARNELVAGFLPEIKAGADLVERATGKIRDMAAVLRTLWLIRNPLNKSNPLTVWDQFALLAEQAPSPPPPKPAPPTPSAGAAFDPDAESDAKKAAAAAKKIVDEFAKDIETLRESAAKSTFAMAGLVLDEFAAARSEAARGLSETMRAIETAEAHAVEVAKGSAEKIRQARAEANIAELAAVAKFEADKTAITRKETEERARLEKKRREDNERFIENIPTDASPDVAATIAQAKASSLDLQQILTEGLGNALSAFGQGAASAFEEFIFGTKSAADAFQDFAAQTLKAIADVIIQMLVVAAVQKAIGFVTGGTDSNLNAFLSQVNSFASGGIVTRPTLSLIGEAGEPEAIVPLSKAQQLGFGGGGEISVTTIVNVGSGGATSQTQQQGSGQSGATLARLVKSAVLEVIRNEQRSGGSLSQPRNG